MIINQTPKINFTGLAAKELLTAVNKFAAQKADFDSEDLQTAQICAIALNKLTEDSFQRQKPSTPPPFPGTKSKNPFPSTEIT